MDTKSTIEMNEFFEKVIASNSLGALILIALGMAIWIVGGNVLTAMHYRRLGKSAWSCLNPFAFPFKNFNAREWTVLAVLAAIGFACFGIALNWR